MFSLRTVLASLASLVVGLAALGTGCAAEKVTPTATATQGPVATATATSTPRLGATPTPTQVILATPTPTTAPASTPTSTPVPKPVVLKMGSSYWSAQSVIYDPHNDFQFDVHFDRLANLQGTGPNIPRVATKWEWLDPLTLRVTIRTDLKFHDGTPVTIDDVVYSVNRTLKPDHGYIGFVNTMKEAVKVDAQTFDIKLLSVDVLVPMKLHFFYVLSKRQLEEQGVESLTVKPLGSGPWRWTKWVDWTYTFAERVPTKHPFRDVHIDRVEMWNMPDSATTTAALRTGAIDYAYNRNYTPEEVKDLEKRGYALWSTMGGPRTVILNPMDACRLQWPTCDKRVRKALNLAIDRESIAKNILLGTVAATSQVALPGSKGYNQSIPQNAYDPKEAERLLDEAGYKRGPDGVRFHVNGTSWNRGPSEVMDLAVIDMWKKIGVEVKYSLVEIGVYYAMYVRAEGREWYPISFIGGGSPDTYGDNTSPFITVCSDLKKCVNRYDNPDYMDLRTKIFAERDTEKRTKLVEQVNGLWWEDPPVLVMVPLAQVDAYKPGWEGFKRGRGSWTFLDGIRWTGAR